MKCKNFKLSWICMLYLKFKKCSLSNMFDYLYLVIYRIPKAIFMALFCWSHFFYLWEMLKWEKISICKCDIFWHLMWIVFLPFGWANSIKTDWWTCNLWSNQSVSYKSVNTFDWIYPTQLAKTNLHQMSKNFTFWLFT